MEQNEVDKIIGMILGFKEELAGEGVDSSVVRGRATRVNNVIVMQLSPGLYRVGPNDYGKLIQELPDGTFKIDGIRYRHSRAAES